MTFIFSFVFAASLINAGLFFIPMNLSNDNGKMNIGLQVCRWASFL